MENYNQAPSSNNNQNHQNYNPSYTQSYSQQQSAYNYNQNPQQHPQFFVPQQPFVPSTFVPPAPPPPPPQQQQQQYPFQNNHQNYTTGSQHFVQQGGFAHDFITSTATNYLIGQVQGSQHVVQKVQERMGFISGFLLNYHFAVSTDYVKTKLMILLIPFLGRWNYTRMPEQIAGGPKYRAPRADVNCPDLYIPLMAFFTYCIISCFPSVMQHTFTPDVLYTKMYSGLVGWIINIILLKCLMYAMSMQSSVSIIEAICYTGYMFVQICLQITIALTKINYASIVVWLYSSLCVAAFLVRSLKALMRHEARHYGVDISRHNYLLLFLAAMQFVSVYFMGA